MTLAPRLSAAAIVTAAAITVLSGCGAGAGPSSASPARSAGQSPGAGASGTAAASPAAPLPVAPGAGALPQTSASPVASGPAFGAVSTDLWLAVKAGQPSLARPAFFPVRAYERVKAYWNPASDWQYRLWLDFSLDVRAAHALLGPGAPAAQLVRVIVPASAAVWVSPGACYNRVGYWQVSGPRVVYRLHGRERSFGIASMISWRGIWYVIHFGGITRPPIGMVDAPAAGPGRPGPPRGC